MTESTIVKVKKGNEIRRFPVPWDTPLEALEASVCDRFELACDKFSLVHNDFVEGRRARVQSSCELRSLLMSIEPPIALELAPRAVPVELLPPLCRASQPGKRTVAEPSVDTNENDNNKAREKTPSDEHTVTQTSLMQAFRNEHSLLGRPVLKPLGLAACRPVFITGSNAQAPPKKEEQDAEEAASAEEDRPTEHMAALDNQVHQDTSVEREIGDFTMIMEASLESDEAAQKLIEEQEHQEAADIWQKVKRVFARSQCVEVKPDEATGAAFLNRAPTNKFEHNLLHLQEMGFASRESCIRALIASDGELQQAIDALLSGNQ